MSSWTQTSISSNWNAIANSSSGQYSYAVLNLGRVYKSIDKGLNWFLINDTNNNINTDLNWSDISCSSDGTKVFGCVYGDYIYVSTDSGNSWTPRHVVSDWTGIASDNDGIKLCACAYNDKVHISNDGGLTWTTIDGNKNYLSTCTSSDRNYIFSTEETGHIITMDLIAIPVNIYNSNIRRNWSSITCNSDGSIIIASTGLLTDGYLYISTDLGVTFTQITTSIVNTALDWTCINTSNFGNGQYISGTVNDGGIYVSLDYGVNWTLSESLPITWKTTSISSDGQIINAAVNNGYIYNTQNGTACFCYDTNILIFKDNIELYEKIQNLKIGELIKTYKNGYIELTNISYSIFENDKSIYQICKISGLENQTEDLFLTGGHSLLVDIVNYNQQKEILKYRQLESCKIEDKYLLMACCLDSCEKIDNNNKYKLYHLVLKNDNHNGQYGIYSNGLLSESMSYNCYKSITKIKII